MGRDGLRAHEHDRLLLVIDEQQEPLCRWSGEQPLQVARCTKIINADTDDPKYIINVKQFAKFVVDLSDQVAPTDIEEGMRVGFVAVFIW